MMRPKLTMGSASEAQDAFGKQLVELISHIAKTEDYLQIPRGTIFNASDSDFVVTLKMHGTIEPMLADAIRAHIAAPFSHPKVHFDGLEALQTLVEKIDFDRKRKLALDLGVINQVDSDFIDAVSKIRNHYAHHVRNSSLNLREIAQKVSEIRNDKRILGKLVSLEGLEDPDPLTIKFSMLLALAGILARLMNTIEPPPFLGFLGEALAQYREESPEGD